MHNGLHSPTITCSDSESRSGSSSKRSSVSGTKNRSKSRSCSRSRSRSRSSSRSRSRSYSRSISRSPTKSPLGSRLSFRSDVGSEPFNSSQSDVEATASQVFTPLISPSSSVCNFSPDSSSNECQAKKKITRKKYKRSHAASIENKNNTGCFPSIMSTSTESPVIAEAMKYFLRVQNLNRPAGTPKQTELINPLLHLPCSKSNNDEDYDSSEFLPPKKRRRLRVASSTLWNDDSVASTSSVGGMLPSANVNLVTQKFTFSKNWKLALSALKAFSSSVDASPVNCNIQDSKHLYPYQLSDSSSNYLKSLCNDIQPSNIASGCNVAPRKILSATFSQHRVIMHHPDIPELAEFLSSSKLSKTLDENVSFAKGLGNLSILPEETLKDASDRQMAASSILMMDCVSTLLFLFNKFTDDSKIDKMDKERLSSFKLLVESLSKRIVAGSVAQAADTRLRLRRKLIPKKADHTNDLLESSFISDKLCSVASLVSTSRDLQGKKLQLKKAQQMSKTWKDLQRTVGRKNIKPVSAKKLELYEPQQTRGFKISYARKRNRRSRKRKRTEGTSSPSFDFLSS